MRERSRGLIYTNSYCIGCNRCISTCPIPGANISLLVEGKNKIIVDADKCIHCGHCIDTCSHDAREYEDDTDKFFNLLSEDRGISLLVSPSFYLDYGNKATQIVNYFSQNFGHTVYNTGWGADISTWTYLKYSEANINEGYISSTCPAVVNYVEKYTAELSERLMPIHSPAICTAIYAREQLHDENEFAFISPCIAAKDEFGTANINGISIYNITYRHLFAKLEELKIDLTKYSSEVLENTSGLGSLYSMSGGLKTNLSHFIPSDKLILSTENLGTVYSQIAQFEQSIVSGKSMPFLIDAMNCTRGCILGTGVKKEECDIISVMKGCYGIKAKFEGMENCPFSLHLEQKEKRELLNKQFDKLDYKDYLRTFKERFSQRVAIPDAIIDEIFESMHKCHPEKRTINCHSCGYNSCREMAKAIAMGYNRKDNCVHYENDENRRLYLTDTMTGIPNLNAFNLALENLIEKDVADRYTAISFSILEWELVNERFGYSEGDKGLIELADAAAVFMENDEILARLGNVNFLACVKSSRTDEFIEKLSNIIIHPDNGVCEEEYSVSICAGIYKISSNDRIAGDIVGKTTIAAVLARQRERPGCVYYDDTMRKDMLESLMMIKAFPQAIKDEEFIVYYQPKVHLNSMALYGAEALVRWRNNDMIVPPGKFIPIFEKNGYVRQVDFYVLEQVCRDIRGWIKQGIKPVKISTNFSKLHFKNTDIAQHIAEIVDKYEIPHNLIEIEFTETAFLDEQDRLRMTLRSLKENGFSSSIDDFGSGYSSLNLLQNLEFEVLKLDKAFLDSSASETKTRKIVASVIAMAKQLNMKVVAEGVEKQEEMNMLKALSCDMIQGFYFDRPMPEEEFVKRLIKPRYSE